MTPRHATTSAPALAVFTEIKAYVLNIRSFSRTDWFRYLSWMMTIFSLLVATSTFVFFGYARGVVWPSYVWWVPFGNFLFCSALALDDIGHRTVYKE